ncbi:MAG: hypothetical protein Fur005_16930 [Roseiflexaceae bacterium]
MAALIGRCVYPLEHYPYWEARLGRFLPNSTAFGENFSVTGLLETDVHLGDQFRVGQAIVQVSMMREPCYKLAARFQEPKMALYLQQEGRTGFFLRVLQEGLVTVGDTLDLIAREDHGIIVAEANRIINVDRYDIERARRLLAVPSLARRWRAVLEQRAGGAQYGIDSERLFLPE